MVEEVLGWLKVDRLDLTSTSPDYIKHYTILISISERKLTLFCPFWLFRAHCVLTEIFICLTKRGHCFNSASANLPYLKVQLTTHVVCSCLLPDNMVIFYLALTLRNSGGASEGPACTSDRTTVLLTAAPFLWSVLWHVPDKAELPPFAPTNTHTDTHIFQLSVYADNRVEKPIITRKAKLVSRINEFRPRKMF